MILGFFDPTYLLQIISYSFNCPKTLVNKPIYTNLFRISKPQITRSKSHLDLTFRRYCELDLGCNWLDCAWNLSIYNAQTFSSAKGRIVKVLLDFLGVILDFANKDDFCDLALIKGCFGTVNPLMVLVFGQGTMPRW